MPIIVYEIYNDLDAPVHFIIEPYAYPVELGQQQRALIHISFREGGALEAVVDGGFLTLFLWPTTTIDVQIAGTSVMSSNCEVPHVMSRSTVREFSETLFGRPDDREFVGFISPERAVKLSTLLSCPKRIDGLTHD